jgi:hypothetical protein
MTKKQFLSLLAPILVVTLLYVYGTVTAISSRGKCADYAMNLTVQSFPDSFIKTRDEFPPTKLKAEFAESAKANYELFYNFCVNKRGIAG